MPGGDSRWLLIGKFVVLLLFFVFFPRGSFQSPNGVLVILSKVTEHQSKQLQRKDWVVYITCLCSLLYVFLECINVCIVGSVWRGWSMFTQC